MSANARKCPKCGNVVRQSDRQTKWKATMLIGGFAAGLFGCALLSFLASPALHLKGSSGLSLSLLLLLFSVLLGLASVIMVPISLSAAAHKYTCQKCSYMWEQKPGGPPKALRHPPKARPVARKPVASHYHAEDSSSGSDTSSGEPSLREILRQEKWEAEYQERQQEKYDDWEAAQDAKREAREAWQQGEMEVAEAKAERIREEQDARWAQYEADDDGDAYQS